jgi:hypothetical protein
MSTSESAIRIGDDLYVDRRDTAAFLRRSVRQLKEWEDRGILSPSTHIGRTPYYSMKDLHVWLSNGGARRRPGRPRKFVASAR